jgi:hypothetical protein
MFWSLSGAQSVMALRSLNAGARLDAFWKNRHAA